MARVLHGMPLSSLPDAGEIKDEDQMVAYRSEDGQAYRTSVSELIMGDLLNKTYPIGSIYMSMNKVDPGSIFGGKWQEIHNCFLLADGDHTIGETGGSETVSLTTAQLPSHTHSIPSLTGTAASAGNHTHGMYYNENYTQSGSNQNMYFSGGTNTVSGSNAMTSAGSHTHSVTTNSSTTGSNGSGNAHENMPPYLTVYMWQRVA